MSSLTLVPTPIDDDSPLCSVAFAALKTAFENNDLIIVEEHKVARRRWLRYGLPREAIENFILYNEHSSTEMAPQILQEIKKGKSAFLMSDCGLPAFCDPGRLLVKLCHENNIKVTATPFANSIALAVALSGFEHDRFVFEGFPPAKSPEREKSLKRIIKNKEMSVLMDTPYRLKKMLEELSALDANREAFLGMKLNMADEKLISGTLSEIKEKCQGEKCEFILILRRMI